MTAPDQTATMRSKNLARGGLPGEIVDAVKIRAGERVEVEAQNGEVVIRRAAPRISLADLFQGKSPEAWRAEYSGAYDWGPDVGREIVPK